MSTTLTPAPHAAAPARNRVTQLHVVRSEWTKLWSLRSTRWSLGVAVLAMIALAIGISAV